MELRKKYPLAYLGRGYFFFMKNHHAYNHLIVAYSPNFQTFYSICLMHLHADANVLFNLNTLSIIHLLEQPYQAVLVLLVSSY